MLATLALLYAAMQLVGMSLYGIEAWTHHADAFGVYFGLFSMLSPLHWRARHAVRAPAAVRRARASTPCPGTVALLCTMIGTTSFDGFSQGALWTGQGGIAPHLQQRFVNLGFSRRDGARDHVHGRAADRWSASSAASTAWASPACARSAGGTRAELSRRFVHSLIPIALAYVVAHYFSLLAYQGQAMAYLVSDPLGHGSNLFGTATTTIDYNVVGANGIWYVQVVALVLGHAAGLTLAHDRALVVYRTPARRDPLAVLDARGHGRLHQPRASGSCPPPPNDRAPARPRRPLVPRAALPGAGASSWSWCSGSRSAASAPARR